MTSPSAELEEGKTEYEGLSFDGIDFSQRDISGLIFDDCSFSSCRFREMSLNGTAFRSCRFSACELALLKFSGLHLSDASFSGCKLLGLNFADCGKLGLSAFFSECLLDSLVFYGNVLKRSRFLKSRLANCDFIECDLRETDFSGSSFERTSFQKCEFAKANFTTARGYSIDPLNNKVSGARFSLPEAASFLGYLGIKLED